MGQGISVQNLISIIVPVYNTEKYLDQCIQSVLAQTYTNWELLLINDGSTDKSGKICDKYSAKDSRIRVFHKSNGGVSSVRNYGMERIKGEYVIHVDSDDWVEPNMLQSMYQKAYETQADMLICDFFEDYTNSKTSKLITQRPSSCENQIVLKELFQHLHGSCCNKLIRSECCNKYHVKFPHNLNMGEDLYFIVTLLMHPIKITYLPKAFYHYVKDLNENSVVKSTNLSILKKRIEIFDLLTKDNACHEVCMRRMSLAIANYAFYRGEMSSKEYYIEMKPYKQWLREKYPPLYGYTTISRIRLLISCAGFYRIMFGLFKLINIFK